MKFSLNSLEMKFVVFKKEKYIALQSYQMVQVELELVYHIYQCRWLGIAMNTSERVEVCACFITYHLQ